jgi:tetratricopeptide (TPR) repeat protein
MSDVPGAKAYFDQLLSLSRDPEQVVKVAFSFLAARQVQGAAEVLDQGRKNTEEPRLHFYAGLVHERMRDWNKAIDAFQAVPKDAPGDLFHEARLHRAICLSSEGQHRAALDLFKKVSEDRPGAQGLDAAWARACERAGQPKDAEALLLRAMSDAPSNETYEAIIGFYARQGRPQEAATLFSSAVGKAPADQALQFALASALERKGEWQKAVETMQKVLAKDQANAAAMNFIGYTLADHGGDLDEAERQVRKALETRPDSAAFLDSLGWVLFKKGDLEHAIDALVRATEEAPDEPTLLEHLGDAHVKAGHKDKALEAYSHAKQLLTENPDGAERPTQKVDLERKLKSLPQKAAGR